MILVRRVASADLPVLVAQVRALARHQGDPDDLFTEEAAERDLVGPRAVATAWLAEDENGVPLGCAIATPAYEPHFAARGLYVSALWVEPSARRKGVARALLSQLAREVEARGDDVVWWVSKAWNSEAHAFYSTVVGAEEDVRAHAVFGESLKRLAAE